MDSRSTKTPYNSIYEPIKKNAPKIDELCCCVHGVQCAMGKANPVALAAAAAATGKQEDDQYVNLMAPPTAESKMVSQLTTKLHKLAADERASRKCEAVSLESLQHLPPPPASSGQYRKPFKNPTDTDQSYIMLGTEDQTTKSSLPPTDSTYSNVTKPDDSNFKSCAAAVYLGAMTRSQAEQQVVNITEFALYHHFSKTAKLDTLCDALPLILVYRTSSNQFKHYPIRTTSSGGEVQYFVDYGRANVRKHWSLNQLVKYYQTHVSFDANNQGIADVFSDWHD